jgi:hypothetical protein
MPERDGLPTYAATVRRCKHNHWEIREHVYVRGALYLNVVRASGKPRTLRCQPPIDQANERKGENDG